jgi:hypothetical protein
MFSSNPTLADVWSRNKRAGCYQAWACSRRLQSASRYQPYRKPVRCLCVAAQVANDVGGKKPSLWVISRQEFDSAEPVPLVSPVWLQIILAGPFSRSHDLPFFRLSTPKLAVQGRYNQSLCLWVSSCSLQGIAERPLPCNYNVIQFVCAPFHGGNTGSNPVGRGRQPLFRDASARLVVETT